MNDKDEEKVPADGYIKVPKSQWYQVGDALTRQDELLEAVLKVLGSMNEKLAELPTAEWPEPPEWPAPPEWPEPPEWPKPPKGWEPVTDKLEKYIDRIEGTPVIREDRYVGDDIGWQNLVSWHVGYEWSKRWGSLRELSMASDDYASTRFRLRIWNGMKETVFEDIEIQGPLTLPFHENKFSHGTWIYLDCRSTGPVITVNGSITGKEWK